MTYRIKAYTAQGMITSLPFFDKHLYEDILFNLLRTGCDVHQAFLSSGNGSQRIYSKPPTHVQPTDTRSDRFAYSKYGILLIHESLKKLRSAK